MTAYLSIIAVAYILASPLGYFATTLFDYLRNHKGGHHGER